MDRSSWLFLVKLSALLSSCMRSSNTVRNFYISLYNTAFFLVFCDTLYNILIHSNERNHMVNSSWITTVWSGTMLSSITQQLFEHCSRTINIFLFYTLHHIHYFWTQKIFISSQHWKVHDRNLYQHVRESLVITYSRRSVFPGLDKVVGMILLLLFGRKEICLWCWGHFVGKERVATE